MNIIELIDLKPKPDTVYPYPTHVRDGSVPLIIDNGSYQCRAGWPCDGDLELKPMLEFRNLIAKPRKDRSKKDAEAVTPPIQIGNDILNIEAMRFQLKTQFDRNVVTHYHNQEHIFDYVFKHLGIDEVPHPIVITECFANPNFSRQLMSELLFECYDIPAVAYGIDSLFSFENSCPGSQNGLIISLGYHTTHVMPMLRGRVVGTQVRRINIGGYHMINYLHRLLQLKYPVHTTAVTLSRVEWMLHNHCSIALDYMDSLRNWAGYEYYEANVKKMQLSFNAPVVAQTMSAEQKTEKRRGMAKRLADINARKREEKLADDEMLVHKMLAIREMYEDGDHEEFEYSIKQLEIESYEELEKQIQSTVTKIDRTKQKMAQQEIQSNTQSVTFEERPAPQPPADVNISDWVVQTRQKRLRILERRNSRRQRKQDLAKRRTAAAQERMRVISQLARKEKGTDDFGMRDEDWDVYKTISKDTGDSDSEAENERLVQYEEVLRYHDPDFFSHISNSEGLLSGAGMGSGDAAELYQLHVGVESIRAPELLFQPSMIGICEAGIAETIDFVLKNFSTEEQDLLANNVFLTGGCANYPGLKERLFRELREIRPFQSSLYVHSAKQPTQDAWLGAAKLASDQNVLNEILITRTDYSEKGGEYLREHRWANAFCPTPAPIVVADSNTTVPMID